MSGSYNCIPYVTSNALILCTFFFLFFFFMNIVYFVFSFLVSQFKCLKCVLLHFNT